MSYIKTWIEIIEMQLITFDLFVVNCQYFKVEAIEWTVMEWKYGELQDICVDCDFKQNKFYIL